LAESPLKSIQLTSLNGWQKSKRVGYKEFDGELTAYYEDGSELYLKSDVAGDVSIVVNQNGKQFIINESDGVHLENGFFPGRVEYQSELSSELVSDILENKMGDGLPTIKQSVDQHLAFFKAIRNCKSLQIDPYEDIPIT
jgi:hypothetical protein